MEQNLPKIAQAFPYKVTLETNKTYAWCTCGLSTEKQPMCDGAHKTVEGMPFRSLKFEVPETGKYWLCGCKQTKNPPYCDGSHKMIEK